MPRRRRPPGRCTQLALVAVGGHVARVSFVWHAFLREAPRGPGDVSLLVAAVARGWCSTHRFCFRASGSVSCSRDGRRSGRAARCSQPTATARRGQLYPRRSPGGGSGGRHDRTHPGRSGDDVLEEGYPPTAKVGVDGLEQRVFQRRLAGRLGGQLLGGTHVLRGRRQVAERRSSRRSTRSSSRMQSLRWAAGTARYHGDEPAHRRDSGRAAGIAWMSNRPARPSRS